jgi:biopolymer transport protein ExbD
MKFNRSHKRFTEIPAASMPDIAFLLIIFFLVTSVIALKQGIIILLPKDSSQPLVLPKEQIIRVELLPGGRVRIDDQECGMAGMAAVLHSVDSWDVKPVLLLIDPQCAHKYLVEAVGRIQDTGISTLSFNMRKDTDENN